MHANGRILINQENQELFVDALEEYFQREKINIENKEDNVEIECIGNNKLIPLIHKALKVCKISRPKNRVSNTFPTNPWYDEECEDAKRSLKGKEADNESRKKYKYMIKQKN